MNRKIIIAAIIVLLALLVGIFVLTSGSTKEDTTINFLTNSSLKNGDAVKFQLTDSNGKPISNMELIIAFENNGTVDKYSISTDENGTGSLVLNELNSGEYKINVTYNGNDKYNPSSAAQALIVGGESSNQPTQDYSSSYQTSDSSGYSSSSSSSSSSGNDVSSADVFDYNGGESVSENANGNMT